MKATSLIFCCDSPSNIVVPFPGEAHTPIGPCFQCELMWWEKDLSLAPAHRKPGWDCGNKPCLRVAPYRGRTQSPISGRAGALWPCAMTFLLQVVEWHRASTARDRESACVFPCLFPVSLPEVSPGNSTLLTFFLPPLLLFTFSFPSLTRPLHTHTHHPTPHLVLGSLLLVFRAQWTPHRVSPCKRTHFICHYFNGA